MGAKTTKQKLSQFIHNKAPLRKAKAYLEAFPVLFGERYCSTIEWSQHGEDPILLEELSQYINNGYYVDIGANHPTKNSNTYRLYCLGMRGITVEPNQELHQLQKKLRPGDFHLGVGCSQKAGLSVFHEFNYHVFSTYSEEEALQLASDPSEIGLKLLKKEPTPVLPLHEIIKKCKPLDRDIFSLLSIDTEGLDELVLRSNNWDLYRPKIIIVEGRADSEDQVKQYLENQKYEAFQVCQHNTLYRECL